MAAAESIRGSSVLLALANMWVPGVYAWATTVGYPASAPAATLPGRVSAVMALIALVAGPIVALERPRLGRALGVLGFLGMSLVTWILLAPLLSIQNIEPVRAAFGALGWLLFAFGWGAVRPWGAVPEDNPRAIPGAPLPARGRLPTGTIVVFSLGCAGAITVLLLAWRVSRPAHALLAHSVAIGCAVWLVTAGATIALERGRTRIQATPRDSLNLATRSIAALLLLLALGFLWLLLG